MIKVYTTSTCQACPLVKDWLKENGHEYQEIPVDNDEARQGLAATGRMTVPVTVIGAHVIAGFNPKEMEEALNA